MLEKHAKFTIGTMVSNWHQKNNRGVGTDFKYLVNNIRIIKTGSYNLRKGQRCLILYDSLSPQNCLMLGNHIVPYNIEAPSNGWKFNEIPIPIDSAELKEYFDELGLK